MNIYNIPARYNFSKNLVQKLYSITDNDQSALSEYIILVPSNRAVSHLKEAFIKYNINDTILLPSISAIGEFDEDDIEFNSFIFDQNIDIPSAISNLEQKILLADLINKYIVKNNIAESIHLSGMLISFLSELQREQIDLSVIKSVFPEELSIHWQKIMNFLEVISIIWPKILKERKLIDPIDRRNLIIEEKSRYWSKHPPKNKIIIAGSTGSLPATRKLMKIIANLDNSMVILPALDDLINENDWDNIDESHPQFILKTLLKYLDIDRKNIPNFVQDESKLESNINRSILLSNAMHPSRAKVNWHELEIKNDSTDDIYFIECDNIQEESSVIALILREAIEYNKTAALITNNEPLAERVVLYLRKWDIEIYYPSGDKLINNQIYIFIKLVFEMVYSNFTSIEFLSLLKHQFTDFGYNKTDLKDIIYELEIKLFRGLRKTNGLESIKNLLLEEENTKYLTIIELIDNLTKALQQIVTKTKVSFIKILDSHMLLIDKICSAENIWSSPAGKRINEILSEIRVLNKNIGMINPINYLKILDNIFISKKYTKSYKQNTKFAIMTPIEARMHNFDLIILSSLNENIWPEHPETGPWVSRNMRDMIGLSSLDRKISQSAHDFYNLSHTKEVIYTRSLKIGGTLTVPSRWLQRINTMLSKIEYNKTDKNRWKKWLKMMYETGKVITSPYPKPQQNARPIKLSATQIEKLIRNPYEFYASKILNLKPIEDIDRKLEASDFGNFIHKILEIFFKSKKYNEENYLEIFDESALIVTNKFQNTDLINNIWLPRLKRIIKWLIDHNYLHSENEVFTETTGSYNIKIDNRIYQITAKADRIELNKDNELIIIDYKTGIIPEQKNIERGISLQMIIEALIAKYNGYLFQNKNIEYKIKTLKYIRLTGLDIAGEIKIIKNIDKIIDEAKGNIENLIELFHDENTGYQYLPKDNIKAKYNQYEHLARSKEWIE